LGYEILSNLLNPSIKLSTKQTLNEDLQRGVLKAKIDYEGGFVLSHSVKLGRIG